MYQSKASWSYFSVRMIKFTATALKIEDSCSSNVSTLKSVVIKLPNVIFSKPILSCIQEERYLTIFNACQKYQIIYLLKNSNGWNSSVNRGFLSPRRSQNVKRKLPLDGQKPINCMDFKAGAILCYKRGVQLFTVR